MTEGKPEIPTPADSTRCPSCRSSVTSHIINNRGIRFCENMYCTYVFDDNLKLIKNDGSLGSDDLDSVVEEEINETQKQADSTQCPLCHSKVISYFINNDKIRYCGNLDCTYTFDDNTTIKKHDVSHGSNAKINNITTEGETAILTQADSTRYPLRHSEVKPFSITDSQTDHMSENLNCSYPTKDNMIIEKHDAYGSDEELTSILKEVKSETLKQIDSALRHSDQDFQLCPKCHSEVRTYFVNFNLKTRVCENMKCNYGLDNLKLEKHDDRYASDEMFDILVRPRNATDTDSSPGATALASPTTDLHKFLEIYEFEGQIVERPSIRNSYGTKNKINNSATSNIDKDKVVPDDKKSNNVESIRKLCLELNIDKKPALKGPLIKNEKWLKNLMKMQRSCRKPLVSSEEASLIDNNKWVGLPKIVDTSYTDSHW